jgi:hypothetical protein
MPAHLSLWPDIIMVPQQRKDFLDHALQGNWSRREEKQTAQLCSEAPHISYSQSNRPQILVPATAGLTSPHYARLCENVNRLAGCQTRLVCARSSSLLVVWILSGHAV